MLVEDNVGLLFSRVTESVSVALEPAESATVAVQVMTSVGNAEVVAKSKVSPE